MVHTYISSHWKVGEGRSIVQGHPKLHSKFPGLARYVGPSLSSLKVGSGGGERIYYTKYKARQYCQDDKR